MDVTPAETVQLKTIPLEQVRVSRTVSQSERRKRFRKEDMAELVESVRTHNVLQPIIVRRRPARAKGEHQEAFDLVAGERRYLAAKAAKLDGIPAVVRDLTDEQVIEIQLIENLQREGLHPMQEAEGYQELVARHGHPVEEIYGRIGKSRSYVYGRLKLIALGPKARKAFYDGKIGASVALLVARIPEGMQEKALKEIAEPRYGPPLSYRQAQDLIHRNYMRQLKGAPFPTADPKLNGGAGSCDACPKRTGNQEGDLGGVGADVCTDPPCFEAKTRAYGQRQVEAARAAGRTVLVGAAAKAAAPYGVESLHGYARLDHPDYRDSKHRKVRQIVGKEAETAVLQDPATGVVVEVVKQSVVDKALRLVGEHSGRQDDGTRAARKKALAETKFRDALYALLRPRLAVPTLRLIAEALFARLHHDTKKKLCKVREFEPPKRTSYGYTSVDYDALGKKIATMSEADLGVFINDCYYVEELIANTWSNAQPTRLLAAAKAHKVNLAKLRREVAAPAKRATKQKPAAKRRRKGGRG